jgi:hypothetical protein
VYIADSDINRVRRVLTGGTIETIATLRHPKAPYALRTATGHDLVVPNGTDAPSSASPASTPTTRPRRRLPRPAPGTRRAGNARSA